MSDSIVLAVEKLGFPWKTRDPFLFCAHHDDDYPPGNQAMGPAASLEGRNIGMDFEIVDGWRMYHGDVVPGFPRHPHRGFETVTLARRGYIDHSDSLGATARFGHGDVQWMTAGRGIVHSEMFPLVDRERRNPTEMFQIWLNLPRADKLVEPHFAMLWSETIPRRTFRDDDGRGTEVAIIAGALGELVPPAPPPSSWASHDDSDVAIWLLAMEPEATWTLPPAQPGSSRTLYHYRGGALRAGGREVTPEVAIALRADAEVRVANGPHASELLLLQGKPIEEPVAQYGPFVMNSPDEIQQAMLDFRRTGFGGWPWTSDAPVHPREKGRFAIHADGRVDEPNGR